MVTKNFPCPSCGKPAHGNFCSQCGIPIVSVCLACNAKVKPGSRLCQACGLAFTAKTNPKTEGATSLVTWVALGLAIAALIVSLLSWFDHSSKSAASLPNPESASAPFAGGGKPPDLSSMTPREAADRLFNRVMAASERGDGKEAQRFAPMALQAYANLGELDNDARYHVALIYLTSADTAKASEQIKNIRHSAPQHLLAAIVEHDIGEIEGNEAVADKANKTFLAAYAKEIALGRPEYQDHQGTIARFRQAALTAAARKK